MVESDGSLVRPRASACRLRRHHRDLPRGARAGNRARDCARRARRHLARRRSRAAAAARIHARHSASRDGDDRHAADRLQTGMTLTVVVLSGLWPILLNAASAVRQIDPLLLDVAYSFRLTAWQRMNRIILPAIVPSLLIGIRIAIPLAIVVTLLVEMLTSLPGIGALMIRSQRNYQSSEVYALLVFVGLFGFVVNDLFAVVEGVIMRRWPPRE